VGGAKDQHGANNVHASSRRVCIHYKKIIIKK